ncbi:MAG: hypothetical protein DHS20C07_22420 [Methyloligella sp.]|nr:MAG: hypothetical protein DHS20C07_22420 [Methyloligella sp.]
MIDTRTKLEKTLGRLAYNYVGTALRTQLWMVFGLSITYFMHKPGEPFFDSLFVYLTAMTFSFGFFFPYLSTYLRHYTANAKGPPHLWWLIVERTMLPIFFIVFCNIAKQRLDRHYSIGQQWISSSKKLCLLEQSDKLVELSDKLAQENEQKQTRLLKIINWGMKRYRNQSTHKFVNAMRAVGQHIDELEPHYNWGTSEETLCNLFERYNYGLPTHKELIEDRYRTKMSPSYDGKHLPEISPQQPTFEGKMLYLAVLIRAEQDKHYNKLDFKRSDFKRGHFVYKSDRSAIDIDYWKRNLPAINVYLGGEWMVEPIDGTSLMLFKLQELPPVIPFQTEFLRDGEIFYGFNVRTGERYYNDLDKFPHHLIVGQSGSGKSVFLNQVMASVIHNMDYFEKIVLVDLKGGVELGKYEGLHSNIELVDDYDALLGSVEKVYAQLEARLKLMKQKGHTIFDGPHLCMIVDEYAQIQQFEPITKQEKEAYKLLLSYLNRISMKGRAARVTIWAQLQKATVDNISSSFRNNLQTKICFKVHSNTDAAIVFGNAADLPGIASLGGFKNLPKGRFVLSDDVTGEDVYMQAAMLDDGVPLARLLQTAGGARVVSEEQVDEQVREAE